MIAELWLTEPEEAYAKWQRAEATGVDRRAFAEQSIVQHRSMFSRFNDCLLAHGQTVATFGPDHIEAFFAHSGRQWQSGTTTRLRYLKLVDRLVRHLIALDLRKENPVGEMLIRETWPEDEPVPVYLSAEDDLRLQQALKLTECESFKELRNTAIVALFLASGVTAAELRDLHIDNLDVDDDRPTVYVAKRGPRIARRVPIDEFAWEQLRAYGSARRERTCANEWLFVATAGGKPMKPDTLGLCVRSALRNAGVPAADQSPRLLRNTYGRRHISAGKTNEQVSSLLGLSSHRTATRLRQTLGVHATTV